MKVFISIKYQKENFDAAQKIKDVIKSLGHEPYCFAIDEDYIENEKELMQKAFHKIDESDTVLIESSHSSFGVGIEAGYAFAKNKKVISIVRETREISNTLKGISDFFISYNDFEELSSKLKEVLNKGV